MFYHEVWWRIFFILFFMLSDVISKCIERQSGQFLPIFYSEILIFSSLMSSRDNLKPVFQCVEVLSVLSGVLDSVEWKYCCVDPGPWLVAHQTDNIHPAFLLGSEDTTGVASFHPSHQLQSNQISKTIKTILPFSLGSWVFLVCLVCLCFYIEAVIVDLCFYVLYFSDLWCFVFRCVSVQVLSSD